MTEQNDEAALQRLFDAGRQVSPPSDDFLSRLDADALDAMPRPVATFVPRRRWWHLAEGWGAIGALASTAAVGVWIGVALPDTVAVPGFDTDATVEEVAAFLPGYGTWALGEEG